MGLLEKIKAIEDEVARTQKNKATEYHLGLLKAKLARYRTELMEGGKSGGAKGEGFDVLKSGDARVALIGFPSIPGVINYKDARIQLLDLPGIIEGASQGKGRGRQVIGVARTSDLVIMMLDAAKAEIQKELLTMELDAVGIRINKQRPNITIKTKKSGGVHLTSLCGDLTHLDVHQARNILHLYKINNAEILVREDITIDEFIDVVEGNRVYLRCLYVINKIDTVHLDEVDKLAHTPDTIVISCQEKLNLDLLLDKIWEYLDFIRIYCKPRGKRPDFTEPLILRNGTTIEHVCHAIHRELSKSFKYALVWGTSAIHQPQRTGIHHMCEDEDVVQIMTK